ncbi:MAG: GDP-mannose 4,6-dehydratase [Patescibacteria group bacterium]|nr:GDP-mannose 4,6-dehydratase [Patescibacteria group bacterium]
MKKALITGISGFAGSFLAEHLILKGNISVSGTYLLEKSLLNLENIRKKLNLVKLDLQDTDKTYNLIKDLMPDYVFHLAALTSPKDSFDNPTETIVNNIVAQINVLEAIRKSNLINTRILVVSSAHVYGSVKKEDLPINEETKLMPANPYSVSKVTQDFLGLQYFLAHKLKIVRVRPFNHIGPRQSSKLAVASFAKKIAEIEKGIRKPILSVGNLESARDFTDVRDMVKAYVLAIEKGKEGEVYNIGSGKSYKISDILNKLLSFSDAKITIEMDKSLLRPVDSPELLCDRAKFSKLTNWKPEISIENTLKDTLDYWRNII